MNAEEIRERMKTSPGWVVVEIMSRLEALEAKVMAMEQPPKRGRPKKVNNGTIELHRASGSGSHRT